MWKKTRNTKNKKPDTNKQHNTSTQAQHTYDKTTESKQATTT